MDHLMHSRGELPLLSEALLKVILFHFSGHRDESTENSMVQLHWRLVRNVSRSEGIKEWQRMAVKVSIINY